MLTRAMHHADRIGLKPTQAQLSSYCTDVSASEIQWPIVFKPAVKGRQTLRAWSMFEVQSILMNSKSVSAFRDIEIRFIDEHWKGNRQPIYHGTIEKVFEKTNLVILEGPTIASISAEISTEH